MPGTWTAGYACPVKWTPNGGAEQTLNVTYHSWQEAVDKIDISHTGTAGVEAVLAGLLRGAGNVKAFQDTASGKKYYDTTNLIRAGTSGLFKLYNTSALFHTVPSIILKVNSQKPVAGGVEYDFDLNLNAEASATAYSYPS